MAVVVSEGRLVAVNEPRDRIPRELDLRTEVWTFRELYRRQPNVRTVVSFLARNIASLGIHAFRRVSDTDRERLYGHPVEATISRPNPRTTRYRLIEATISDIAIHDVALWVKLPGSDGAPVALFRVPPSMITPDGDTWLWPDGFKLRGNRGELIIPWEASVFFAGYSPDDNRWGCSPLEALEGILAEEAGANEYRGQLWRNAAKISGVLERPKDAGTWKEGVKEKFRSQWQAFWAGNGMMAGGTPILEDGMTYRPIAMTSRDAEYLGARKLTREEVAAAYHIPPPMVGILDHATFSNIEEQHEQLYQDTFGPWFERVQSEIELQLIPDFADARDVYVEFNIAEKLRGRFEQQAAAMQTMVGAPVMSRNEGRARLNLPRVADPEFDKPITPLNLTSAAGGAAPTSDTPAPADSVPKALPASYAHGDSNMRIPVACRPLKARAEGQEAHATGALAKFFERQGKAVVAKVGAGKARGEKAAVDDVFDRERWDRELHTDLAKVNAVIAAAAAKAAAAQLEVDDYDPEVMADWLDANASGVASGINETSRGALAEALGADDPLSAVKHLFEVWATARAAQIATAQTSAVSGFASTDVARHGGFTSKQWVVTSANPRPSHAAMSGETTDVDGVFSNGGRWPGDSSLPDDERAGCTCDLAFVRED